MTSADPGAALTFVGVVLVVIVAAAITPIILDAWRTARWRDNLTSWITQQRLSGEDLKTALAVASHPRGTQGLTRSLIALLVIVLAAAALSVTLFSTAPDATDLRKTIVTSLLTVLAGVSGFYFGARTAETTTGPTRPQPGPAQPRPGAPVITTITPDKGSNPATVSITGSGLSGATVMFGTQKSSNVVTIDDTRLTAQVPPAAAGSPKSVNVIAVTASGASPSSSDTAYIYP